MRPPSPQLSFDPRPRLLPVLDVQSDIVYREATPRSVLNPPSATGIGCWSLNPYVGCAFGCAYCYARYAHRYAMERAAEGATADECGDPGHTGDAGDAPLPPWLAFERRVMVKRDAPALVRRALSRGSARYRRLLDGTEALVIGTATDPYQPAERRFRVTRAVLEVLAEHAGLRLVIITKSALVARDVDVLARIAARSRLSVHVSLITLDRALARRVEPRAPTPEARVRAIAQLADAGVDVGVNIMPVLPGITDAPRALDALVRRVAAAGATHIAAGALRLQPTARERYLPWVAEEFPELATRYRATYARGPNAGERYRAGLRDLMAVLCARHGVGSRTYDRDGNTRSTPEPRADDGDDDAVLAAVDAATPSIAPPPAPAAQLSLAL